MLPTLTQNKKAKAAADEAQKAQAELQAAKKSGDVAKIQEKETAYITAKANEESWQEGGKYKRRMDAAVMAIGSILSGGTAGQTAVAALSPELNAQIHDLTKDSKTANLLAHAALSALEAKATGNNATAGAVAGLVGEGSAMLLSEVVFNKPANELTSEERNLLKVAGQLAGAVSGNLAGGTTADTVFGAGTAKRAVENNFLSESSRKRFNELVAKRNSGKALTESEKFEILELAYFDQRSDVLVKKWQRGEELSTLEKQELDRFVERYLTETISGRANYSRGKKYHEGVNETVANVLFGEKYLNNTGYKQNYSYPYVFGHTGEWRDKADWKADEVVYREVFNELNSRPSLPQTWQELVQEMQNVVVAKGRGKIPNATNFKIRVPTNVAKKEQVTVGKSTGYENQNIKIDLSKLDIEVSKQNKHIKNTNEYKVALANGQQKSIITTDLDSLRPYIGTGQRIGKNEVGTAGSKERVNFNKVIGNYIDPETGKSSPTTMGVIHYSKNGYHIVPARPTGDN